MQFSCEQMEKLASNWLQSATDLNTLVNESAQAYFQSISIMTQGCSEMSSMCCDLSQKYLEQSVKLGQAMASKQSVNDIVDMQSSAMKDNFDSLVADMSNISEMSSRIAQEAAEPVTSQMNKSFSQLSSKVSNLNCCKSNAA